MGKNCFKLGVTNGEKMNAFTNYANIPIIKVRRASEVNVHFMFTFARERNGTRELFRQKFMYFLLVQSLFVWLFADRRDVRRIRDICALSLLSTVCLLALMDALFKLKLLIKSSEIRMERAKKTWQRNLCRKMFLFWLW